MRKCVFCKSRYQKGNGLSFHRFPTDENRDLWVRNMKVLNWKPTEWDALCSKHFEDDCFNKHQNRTSLKNGSVPTIFDGDCEGISSASSSNVGGISPKSPQSHGTNEIIENVQPQKDLNSYVPSNKQPEITEIKIEIEEELPASEVNYPYKHDISSASSSSVGLIRPKSSQPHGTMRKPSEIISKNIRPQKDLSTVKSEADISISKKAEKESPYAFRRDHEYDSLKKTLQKKYVIHDHSYEKSVRSSWDAQQRTKQALKVSQTRVKVLLQHVKRLKKKVSNLKTVIKDLNKKNKDPDACAHMLTQYDDFKIELFHRMLKNAHNKKYSNDEYPPQLRGFAITLYLYSAKAYTYVRKQFNLALPHPRIIRHWYSSGRKS